MNRIDHKNALPSGYRLQEYTIESLLGHGGFGITYLARDRNLDKAVAIKEYLPQEFAMREGHSTVVVKSNCEADRKLYQWGLKRFVAEAQALARFKHPNIVRVLRFIEANNSAYLVMDYEPGQSLQDYLDRSGCGLAEDQLKAIFLPVLDGLGSVHDIGLLHRDIKPHNIYLRSDSSPMLIDFGSVRVSLGEKSRSLIAVFTPGFAPYEQYSSRGNQGSWTDIYGIGASLYYCMSGRIVPDANDRCFSLLHQEPDPYRSIRDLANGRYSEALLDTVDSALAFRVKDRLATAGCVRARWLRESGLPERGEDLRHQSFGQSSTFATTNRFPETDEPTRLLLPAMLTTVTDLFNFDMLDSIRAFLKTRIRTLLMAAWAFRMRWKKKFAFSDSEIQTDSASRATAVKDTGKNSYTTIAAPKFRTFFHTPSRKSWLAGGLVVSFALALAFAWSWVGPMVSTQVNEKKPIGFPRNAGTSFDRTRIAAEQGDAWAQYELGRMYEKGEGVTKDYEQAAAWYLQSAEQGNEWAQYNLAWLYEKGKGVTKDPEKSVIWYRKSAEQGNAWAQNNLGSMYIKGKGVRKNSQMARHWYRQAAEQGLWVARDNLRGLNRN